MVGGVKGRRRVTRVESWKAAYNAYDDAQGGAGPDWNLALVPVFTSWW